MTNDGERERYWNEKERVLLAAIFRNIGQLRDTVLDQTRATAFYESSRIIYWALRRLVAEGGPLTAERLWNRVLVVADERGYSWHEFEEPSSEFSKNELRQMVNEIVAYRPTPKKVLRVLERYNADDRGLRLARIESYLSERHVPQGAVDRILLAAIFDNLGGMREKLLAQIPVEFFLFNDEIIMYSAFKRTAELGEPFRAEGIWQRAESLDKEYIRHNFGYEQTLKDIENLRMSFDDIRTLGPTQDHLQKALEAYADQIERRLAMTERRRAEIEKQRSELSKEQE